MTIAVAATSKSTDSAISSQGGRAPFYLLLNEQGELLESIKNPFAVGGGGAGFGVAKMVADKGADVIVAGKFGQKMIDALKTRGLRPIEMTGTVSEAVTRAQGA